jgi:hypothetical protein
MSAAVSAIIACTGQYAGALPEEPFRANERARVWFGFSFGIAISPI